jgi:hypothetical protein
MMAVVHRNDVFRACSRSRAYRRHRFAGALARQSAFPEPGLSLVERGLKGETSHLKREFVAISSYFASLEKKWTLPEALAVFTERVPMEQEKVL